MVGEVTTSPSKIKDFCHLPYKGRQGCGGGEGGDYLSVKNQRFLPPPLQGEGKGRCRAGGRLWCWRWRGFALSVRNQRFLTALPKGEPRRFARCTQQGKENSPDFSIEALVFALPIFTARGSEPRAASGRTSKANEWQRSKFRERIASRKFRAPQQGTIVLP